MCTCAGVKALAEKSLPYECVRVNECERESVAGPARPNGALSLKVGSATAISHGLSVCLREREREFLRYALSNF